MRKSKGHVYFTVASRSVNHPAVQVRFSMRIFGDSLSNHIFQMTILGRRYGLLIQQQFTPFLGGRYISILINIDRYSYISVSFCISLYIYYI